MVEISNLCFRERFAERCHALLPLLVPNHCESFDVGEVFGAELDVLPQRAGFPAAKADQIEQHAQFSVQLDSRSNSGAK